MAKRPKFELREFPEPGTVFVAPMADGRLCAGRVLRRRIEEGANAALIVASPWIGSAPPTLNEPELRRTLILNHHVWKNSPCAHWVWDLMPVDFKAIGKLGFSLKDWAFKSQSYGGWESVPSQALLQWRWDHDRDALLREEALEESRLEAERRSRAESRKQLLDSLTLDQLSGREWFQDWDTESAATTAESRQLIAQLVSALQALPELKSGAVKGLLKQAVEAFNRLDAKNHFIDTVEREDICEALEQVLCAARCPQLVDQVDEWREW